MMQDDELSVSKALLRVQDADDQCIHKYKVDGVEMRVVLTSAIFIHPETASIYSFEPLQTVVIIPRLLPRETKKNHETDSRRGKSSVISKEGNVGVLPDKHDIHQTVVRLIFSESVAKGHIMLPRSIRLYLRAELHSCRFFFSELKLMHQLQRSWCYLGSSSNYSLFGQDLLVFRKQLTSIFISYYFVLSYTI